MPIVLYGDRLKYPNFTYVSIYLGDFKDYAMAKEKESWQLFQQQPSAINNLD